MLCFCVSLWLRENRMHCPYPCNCHAEIGPTADLLYPLCMTISSRWSTHSRRQPCQAKSLLYHGETSRQPGRHPAGADRTAATAGTAGIKLGRRRCHRRVSLLLCSAGMPRWTQQATSSAGQTSTGETSSARPTGWLGSNGLHRAGLVWSEPTEGLAPLRREGTEARHVPPFSQLKDTEAFAI